MSDEDPDVSDEFYIGEKNSHVHAYGSICDAIADAARSIGVTGVGAVLVWRPGISYLNPALVIVDSIIQPGSSLVGRDALGVNHMGIVSQMVSEMLVTLTPNGHRLNRLVSKGETPIKGGVVYWAMAFDAYIFVAFSGSEPEKNVAIAMAGIDEHRFGALEWFQGISLVKP